jgi:hypothetical protein
MAAADGLASRAGTKSMDGDTGIGMIGIPSRGGPVNTVIMGRGATEITMTGITNRGDTHASTTRAQAIRTDAQQPYR